MVCKFFHLILVSLLLIGNIDIKSGQAAAFPELTAKSAILIEAKTGKIIYAKDAESRRYPASTTKIMTLIVALERGNQNDMVTASQNASNTEGSSICLESGERLKLSELLYGIMLVSGNDATVAVAEHIAGSVGAFAKLMTQRAHEIGATDTSFKNSSGLPDLQHYSTAHDLAKIAAYGYRNPLFEEIVSTKERTIPWEDKEFGRDLRNENRMLWLYDGGNGVKTGYTNAAGRCLVSAAKRNGLQLIAVVLDSEYMWNDSIALLDYGFAHSDLLPIHQKGEILKTVQVLSGKKDQVDLMLDADLSMPIVNGEAGKTKTVIEAPDQIYAAVQAGQTVGEVKIMYDGVEVAKANLIAHESVDKKSFFAALYRTLHEALQFLWHKLV